MAEDSRQKYKDILAAYNQTQTDLDDLGLTPEAQVPANPIEDMINQANEESQGLDAEAAQLAVSEKLARNAEKKAKLDDNLYSNVNLSADEKERNMSNIENTIKSGTNGKDDLEVIKQLKEAPSEPEAIPAPVLSPQEQLLQRLQEARKERSMEEGYADIAEGLNVPNVGLLKLNLTSSFPKQ